MTTLLHADSPDAALLLLAASEAGMLPGRGERVLVHSSRTAGGRALARALREAGPLSELGVPLDVGSARDAVTAIASLRPDFLVLDAAAPEGARLIAGAAPEAKVMLLDDGVGLASPTPPALGAGLLGRVEALLAPEVVPGLVPVLLRGANPAWLRIPLAAVDAAAKEWAASARRMAHRSAGALARLSALPHPGKALLVLGRPLPDLGAASEAERARLAGRSLTAAQDVGAKVLLFCPSPGTGRAAELSLSHAATEAGLPLLALPDSLPALAAHALVSPRLCLGVDSPALLRLHLGGVARVQSVATGRFLPRLGTDTDPARVRLTLVDAIMRRGLAFPAEEPTLQRIVDAVAYSVAPAQLDSFREEAVATLRGEPALRSAYISAPRLQQLGLPSPRTKAGAKSGGAPAATTRSSRRRGEAPWSPLLSALRGGRRA